MTNASDDIVIVLRADDGQFVKATAEAGEALQRLGTSAGQANGRLGEARAGTKLTRQEVLALNYTLSDVASSLASGASPFTILMQQGGQVRDAFGGFGSFFSKVAGALTVGRVALGGAAAAAGVLFQTFAAGYKDTQEMNRALVLSGNAAGLTADRFHALVLEVENLAQVGAESARSAVIELVRTGQYGPQTIQAAATAVAALAKATGRSEADVVKSFSGMQQSVARWAAEHNRSMNYITGAQYQYIRSLEAQGRTEEAQLYNFDLLNRYSKKAVENLGYVESAWDGIARATQNAWDWMKRIGREETNGERLAKLQTELQERLQRGPGLNKAGFERVNEVYREQIERLRELQSLANRSATAEAASAAQAKREIEESSRQHVDTVLGLERARFERGQAIADLARERERAVTAEAYRRLEITATQFIGREIARERAALKAKEELVANEIALERRRPVESRQDAIAQQARLVDLETKRLGIQKERVALDARVAAGEFKAPERRSDALGEFIDDALNAQRRRDEQRAQQGSQFILQLQEQTQTIDANLIADTKTRGQAIIAIERAQLSARLGLLQLQGQERAEAEGAVAAYTLARERQLTEELRPEWQRRLDEYANVAQLHATTWDRINTQILESSEDMWVELQATGRLSARSLVQMINAELARLTFRQQLAPLIGQGLNVFGGFLGGLFGGSSTTVGTMANAGGASAVGMSIHTGGVVGQGGGIGRMVDPAMFATAPRYHRGGLAANEVPAVLLKGEEVLTEWDPRHRRNGGMQAGTVINQVNNYHVPSGMSPAAYAGALQSVQDRARQDAVADAQRPGRGLYRAVQRA